MSDRGPYNLSAAIIVVAVAEIIIAGLLLLAWYLFLSDVPAFRFERPEMLRSLLVGPVLAVIFLLHLSWRNRALHRFASFTTLGHAIPGISTSRMVLQFLLLRHGLGFALLSLAGPQFGTRLEEVRSEGVDVMVAIDVSNSMAAEDLEPSRIELARRGLSQLIDRSKGDRLGIIIFAGDAFVQLPITTDRSAAKLFLGSVNTDAVGTQGTAIGSAIELGIESFDLEEPASRAIVILTDGENHEDDAEGAARAAANSGIVVHTIGMGTPQGGPIPIKRNGRTIGFKKDANGNTVVSRLNENMLEKIAQAGNGKYVRATERNLGIEQLLEELRSMDRTEIGTWQFTAHESRFQYPLGLGLLLIIASLCFGERRPARTLFQWTSVIALLLLTSCGDRNQLIAEEAIRTGNAHYRSSNYQQAVDEYEKASFDPRALHNSAKAKYRLADHGQAVADLNTTLEQMIDTNHIADVYHDLGNARLMHSRWADSMSVIAGERSSAITLEGDDIAEKVRQAVVRDSLSNESERLEQLSDSALAQSVIAFKNALRLDPKDEDSRYNLVFGQRLLAAREKERKEAGEDQDKNKELSERAKALMKKADELVEVFKFKEALELLQRGLAEDPTLAKEKEYVQKLEVVTKAAEAT